MKMCEQGEYFFLGLGVFIFLLCLWHQLLILFMTFDFDVYFNADDDEMTRPFFLLFDLEHQKNK